MIYFFAVIFVIVFELFFVIVAVFVNEFINFRYWQFSLFFYLKLRGPAPLLPRHHCFRLGRCTDDFLGRSLKDRCSICCTRADYLRQCIYAQYIQFASVTEWPHKPRTLAL